MTPVRRLIGENELWHLRDFQELREVLRDLSLHESGDAVVNKLAELKQAANRVDTADEPWVAEWLSAEHAKAAMLQTAAKTNWRKEQTDGTDRTFNARNRTKIITRFNQWVTECRSGLDAYERSGRTAVEVADRRAALERFRQDPVHNSQSSLCPGGVGRPSVIPGVL